MENRLAAQQPFLGRTSPVNTGLIGPHYAV
jgi:hypothetical protein